MTVAVFTAWRALKAGGACKIIAARRGVLHRRVEIIGIRHLLLLSAGAIGRPSQPLVGSGATIRSVPAMYGVNLLGEDT